MQNRKRRRPTGSKAIKIWEFIRFAKGIDHANSIYEANLNYDCAQRGIKGLTREDMDKYRDGRSEWESVKQFFKKGSKNPYQDYVCEWCGSSVDWRDVQNNNVYCSGDVVGRVGKAQVSKCRLDARQSKNSQSCISTIEAVWHPACVF